MSGGHTALRGRPELADFADVRVEAVVELGDTALSYAQARQLKGGDTIRLRQLAGEAYPVKINGHPFGEGEMVVIEDRLCLRLTRLAPTVEETFGAPAFEDAGESVS